MKSIALLVIIVLSFPFSGCSNENAATKTKELELKEKELQLRERELSFKEQQSLSTSQQPQIQEQKSKRSRELRYLFFANGGIVGYFDDGTITGCPRCDFCKSNILGMFNKEPHGTYIVQTDGSLLINGTDKEVPTYSNADVDGWALIDYKWFIKPPQN